MCCVFRFWELLLVLWREKRVFFGRFCVGGGGSRRFSIDKKSDSINHSFLRLLSFKFYWILRQENVNYCNDFNGEWLMILRANLESFGGDSYADFSWEISFRQRLPSLT